MSVRPAQPIRFKGRSYFSLTISPELPLDGWLERLDGWLERSPGFFSRNSVILDVRDLALEQPAFRGLLDSLQQRGIRVLGVDGGDPAWAGPDVPPFMQSGKDVRTPDSEEAAQNKSAKDAPDDVKSDSGKSETGKAESSKVGAGADALSWAAPLYIDGPVRSGQTVLHPDGDVIVTGSVASGAEVVAAGSIHIYGALRGRAMAGAYGDESARIFCRSLEAELIAVNGLYQTSEEIDPALRKKPAQVTLRHGMMQITKFE